MERSPLSETRYDVFLSALGGEKLFHQDGAETVFSFLRNRLVDKLQATWHDMGGVGSLSIFWEEQGVVESWDKVAQALLQTRGGGLVLCLVTENYFSDEKCARILETAAKLSHKKSPESVLLCVIGLNLDADAVWQHGIMKKLRLGGVTVFPMSGNETDGPGVVARKIAERVVGRLMDNFVVAGKRIKDSFSALLENLDNTGPRIDILANRLGLRGTFSSRLGALREAENDRLIFPRSVSRLESTLDRETGLQYVSSYVGKWLADWAKESWDALATTNVERSEGTRAERATSELPSLPRPRESDERIVQADDCVAAPLPQTPAKRRRRGMGPHVICRTVSEGTDQWTPDFSTVPCLQSFVDAEAIPSVRALLKAVLDDSCGGAVGAVGAHGSGGVGKTTACTIVANDREVRDKYQDGVFWVDLGEDATAEDVKGKLLKLLRSSGGFNVAKEVERIESKNIRSAVSEARSWFGKHEALIVIDNVWLGDLGGSPANWISLLRPLVGAGGCLLFSTRSGSLAATASARSVEFDIVKHTHYAGSIFDKHLGLSVDDERYKLDARARIVEKCKGLPLALANAGLLVAFCNYDWDYVDKDLEKALLNARSDSDRGGHPGLVSTISVTLEKLDNGGLDGWLVRTARSGSLKYSWSDMYHALAVSPRNTASMPISILALLWGLETREAKGVAMAYCDLGLGSMVGGEVLKLHDLQREYCCYRCTDQNRWHEHLVRCFSHLSHGNKSNNSVRHENIVHSLISAECSEYLVENAVRHMAMAYEKHSSLLRCLLTDYQWMRKKAELRSLMSVVADYDLVVNTIKEVGKEKRSDGSGLEPVGRSPFSEEVEGYGAIRDALRKVPYEASPAFVKGELEQDACPVHGQGRHGYPDSGLAGQLVGRLGFQYGGITSESRLNDGGGRTEGSWKGPNLLVAELLESVHKNAVGQWIRPVTYVFQRESEVERRITGEDSELERRVTCEDSSVWCVALSNDDKFVYSGHTDGTVCKRDLENGRLVGVLPGHNGMVTSLAVAVNKSEYCSDIVFSGSTDCTIIMVWSMSLMGCIAWLEGHTEEVTSLAASRDGERLISGSDDKTVRVWIRVDGRSWSSQAVLTHLNPLTSVALSPSGREIASASRDGTVRIWREVCSSGSSNLGEMRDFEAVKSLSVEFVYDLTFSFAEHEPEIICAGNGLWLWDGNSQGPSRVMFAGSNVYSVALSDQPEGKLICGTCDDGIRLWRMDNGSVVRVFSGEYDQSSAISITRDGRRIVCGSSRKTPKLEIWAVGGCDDQQTIVRQRAYTEREPDDVLTHVAASEDRCKIVTVHNLRNMQIWRVGDGSRVQQVWSKFCIEHIKISANGSRIVTADMFGRVVCWNGISGNVENTWETSISGFPFSNITSIALSRNALYLAVANASHVRVWNTEAQKLEAKVERQFGSENAFYGLTAYAKEHGLDSDSNPVKQCGSNPVPGFFVQYSHSRLAFCEPHSHSRLDFYVPYSHSCLDFYVQRRSDSTYSAKGSSNTCSCTWAAMFDSYTLSDEVLIPPYEVWMLPYVRALDTRGSIAELPLGMIVVRHKGREWGTGVLEPLNIFVFMGERGRMRKI